MFCLPQIGITKLSAMHCTKVANLCLQVAPLSVFMQKERWRVSQLKGKYVARLLALIQAIWLNRIRGTYVNKKLMLLMALAELQKLVHWAQAIFSNLHSRL
jgi:hypothetical protein